MKRTTAIAVGMLVSLQHSVLVASSPAPMTSLLTFACSPTSTKRPVRLHRVQRTLRQEAREQELHRSSRSRLQHRASSRRHGEAQRRVTFRMQAASGDGVLLSSAAAVSPTTPSGWVWVPGLSIGIVVGVSVVHALQGGVRGYLGRSQEEILGVSAEEATAADVASLSKAGFMQLFYASPCPQEGELDGEYRAHTLAVGVLHPVASIITHRIWGPGRWLGKALRSESAGGYNLFSVTRDSIITNKQTENPKQAPNTLRERRFGFSLSAPSVFDNRTSAKLNYGRGNGNGLLFGGMRDEVRKVNSRLFLGLGYIQAFGGKYNTAPFVLEGPPVGRFLELR